MPPLQKHLFWNTPTAPLSIITAHQLSGLDFIGILERGAAEERTRIAKQCGTRSKVARAKEKLAVVTPAAPEPDRVGISPDPIRSNFLIVVKSDKHRDHLDSVSLEYQ